MNPPILFARGQQIAAFVGSAVVTLGLLLSLAAQADARHADALLAAHGGGYAQHCALPVQPGRS